MVRMATTHNDVVQAERQHAKMVNLELQDKVRNMSLCLEDQEKIIVRGMTRFAQLTYLANTTIDSILRQRRDVEAVMNPFNTPREVQSFIVYDKELIEDMKDVMAKAKKEYVP
ncbi:hypothetical protein RIF29_09846 [Crotalaria pallida]|uniref:Uncharacterized protein n=1 Tax=Crotalaria pallida TaxID=3830 RepID=A0AAN9FVC2_CROPI